MGHAPPLEQNSSPQSTRAVTTDWSELEKRPICQFLFKQWHPLNFEPERFTLGVLDPAMRLVAFQLLKEMSALEVPYNLVAFEALLKQRDQGLICKN